VTGSTGGHMGAAWGWYMVSDNWAGVFPAADHSPAPYGTKDLKKVVVLMSDGEFNTAHCHGVVSNDQGVGSSDWRIKSDDRTADCNAENGTSFSQFEQLCTNMKAKGVIVFTVGFELAAGGTAEDEMDDCATDDTATDQYAYLAATEQELKDAFAEIATSISHLRISK
jgi:hypothetical protein